MKIIVMIAILTIIALVFGYVTFIQPANINTKIEKKPKINGLNVLILLTLAFGVRFIAAVAYKGYEVDMNCFSSWSDMVFQGGISNFYSSESFTDYPPGYMYILLVIGAIRNTFGALVQNYMILKIPAIICDLAAGYFVYKIAKRRFQEIPSIVLASFFLFNPSVIINSSVWGQVDSVFTLAVVLMCYFVAEEKLPFAYFSFAVGVLLKPQALIFTPVLIYGIIDQVILKDFNWKEFFKQLGLGLLAIFCMFLAILPFGFEKVIVQYTETLKSYPYASVNGYNFWTFFELNWSPQENTFLGVPYATFGSIFIILTVLFATIISFLSKNSKGKYFFTGAIIVCGMFLLSVRMHERYMYPALILLLLTFIYEPRKEIAVLFAGFSAVHFCNVAHVLFFYDPPNYDWDNPIPVWVGFATICMFGYMIYVAVKYYCNAFEGNIKTKAMVLWKKKGSFEKHIAGKKNKTIERSKQGLKFTKYDFIALAVIVVIYGAVALYDLGDHQMPQTAWETEQADTAITLDLGSSKTIGKIDYFLGNYEERGFKIETANDLNGSWTENGTFTMNSVFSWGTYDAVGSGVNLNARYIKLTSTSDRCVVRELVLLDGEGNAIVPENASEYSALFDEGSMHPEISTFRDSTYFDEIYHARTGYEFTQDNLRTYEWTHPPLGKIFIALGMTIFGVNPFGWRIMGTLFGIAMLPFIYLFAKRFFRESWISTLVTVLFAFDFMHFTQTRIATIDVFVTFFIIVMYYFMYQYTQLSFYDTPLKKTWLPLGICGVAMGFGIASKWTGIYAGAGLAIILFWTLWKRYREYCYAKAKPKDATNGISHSSIIDSFQKNTVWTLLFCCVFFIVIPLIIYGLSYIPFRLEDGVDTDIITKVVQNAEAMFSYHQGVTDSHPYSSTWYQWPIMYRPMWYYSAQITDTISEGISAFGNPLVWWAGIPAFFYMIYLAIKKKDQRAGFLCIGYLAQYAPWFLVSRVIFIYHYFPSVPFVTFMVGYSMFTICNRKEPAGEQTVTVGVAEKIKSFKEFTISKKRWIYVCIGYTAAAVMLFIMFYPVISGEPVDKNYVFKWLKWLKTWVLVV